MAIRFSDRPTVRPGTTLSERTIQPFVDIDQKSIGWIVSYKLPTRDHAGSVCVFENRSAAMDFAGEIQRMIWPTGR